MLIFVVLSADVFFFSKSTFSKNSFRSTTRVSTTLDPGHTRRFVGPDLGPNCLQMISADDTSRQQVKCPVVAVLTYCYILILS